jgi:hypothetical protein
MVLERDIEGCRGLLKATSVNLFLSAGYYKERV